MFSPLKYQHPGHEITDEQEFWEDIKSGNKLAFGYLYDHYVNGLYYYGIRICQDPEIVEDCIHDLFVDIWKYKANITIKTTIRLYLAVSLKRSVINKAREKNKMISFEDDEGHKQEHAPTIEEKWIKKQFAIENKRQLHRCIEQLTNRQKEVIHLRFFDNYDYAEISQIMGVSVESAYNLVSKAIATLKKIVKY